MTGYDKKVLHIKAGGAVKIEVDFLGDGSFETYATSSGTSYRTFLFPAGFSAHWVRLVSEVATTATAEFHYT